MSPQHEPTPEFIDRLEWQIRGEIRRQERFDPPAPPLWRRRGLRTAALVVLSVLLGYAGATAAQEVSERRQRELLELQTRTRVEMAELQLRFTDDRLRELQRLASAGEIPREEVVRARMEREFVQREVDAVKLDLEELRATGRPPRHDLAAPPVGGRDLVRARLQLRLESLQSQRGDLIRDLERSRRGAEEEKVRPLEVLYRQHSLEALEREITIVRRSLALREQFVSGALDEDAVRARREVLDARMDLERAAAELELARAQRQELDGIAADEDHTELRRLEIDFQREMAEAQLEMAELRLRMLREAGRVED